METPTQYNNISYKALDAKTKYNLTDTQTLLYNHICRGDFKLRNGDGQAFYDEEHEGFGYDDDRQWVKKQFAPLIKAGLVKCTSIKDCKDGKYTSWYFYDPKYNLSDLIDAGCDVNTHKLSMIKHYFNLPDGFNKNQIYGDLEFICINKKYTFKYLNKDNNYTWCENGNHIMRNFIVYFDSFDELITQLWYCLTSNGYEWLEDIPNYSNENIFTLEDLYII